MEGTEPLLWANNKAKGKTFFPLYMSAIEFFILMGQIWLIHFPAAALTLVPAVAQFIGWLKSHSQLDALDVASEHDAATTTFRHYCLVFAPNISFRIAPKMF